MKDTRDSSPVRAVCRWLLIASAFVALSSVGPGSRNQASAATELERVILVYEVDPTASPDGAKVDMQNLVAAVERRVNFGGQKEIVVRQLGIDQIEIIIPKIKKEELERLKRVISSPGTLEFRILANRRDNKDLIEQALSEPAKMQILDKDGKILAWWVPVKAEVQNVMANYRDIAVRTRREPDGNSTEVLVLPDEYNITGVLLSRAETAKDHRGMPAVQFTFNKVGRKLFGQLTGSHLPDEVGRFNYKLGIILDGKLNSAPGIYSMVREGGQITGSFTKEQVEDLARVLNAGSLPAKIRLVSKTEEPTRP